MSDLIDRVEALNAIKDLSKLYPYKVVGDRETYSTYNEGFSDCADMAESAILNCETVQQNVNTVPVRYARLVKSEIANGYVVCSGCGVAYPLSMKQSVFLNYCSRCGVKFI